MSLKIAFPTLFALALTLGACTDEPSEAAMRQVVERFMMLGFEKEVAQTKKLGVQPPGKPVITSFTKLGCKPAEPDAGYACTFDGAMDGKSQGQMTRRFFTDADGALTMSD